MAFGLLLAASITIYALGWVVSTKSSTKNSDKKSPYACGEKTFFSRVRINVALPKYLIYFMILDSSVLLVAFASLSLQHLDFSSLLIYLLLILATVFMLFEGGE
ncbi:MAG: NADH-quinone oxidoreductase subunit A [Nitrososphaerota archaeon]|nr:NADH-quinone oxidoreductase subunit A [Candidatus Bathyarchaeota archaeon]MDW8193957.1 NADH-quinone oxidoreductase subunit A [Nitrososphaerota archaeon]